MDTKVTLLVYFCNYFDKILRPIRIYTKIKNCQYFRKLPLWERAYCWILIIVGLIGGASATYTAVTNVFGASFSLPCYVKPFVEGYTIEVSASH